MDLNGMSIEEMIRLAATEAMHSTVPEGFDWIEEYQQYYSKDTKFFYDPNTSLFYHTESMTYYTFNDDTREYEKHSCVAPTKWSSGRQKRRGLRCLGETEFGKLNQDDVDIVDLLFGIVDEVDEMAEKEAIRKYRDEQREREKERRKRSPERKRHRSSDRNRSSERHRRHSSRKRSRSRSRTRRSSSERHKHRKRSSERRKSDRNRRSPSNERRRHRSSEKDRDRRKRRDDSTSPERRRRSSRERERGRDRDHERENERERERRNPPEVERRHWTVEDIQRSLKRRRKEKKEDEFKQVYFDEETHEIYTNASTSSDENDDGWNFQGHEQMLLMAQEGFNQAPLLRIIDATGNLSIVTISEGFIGSDEKADIQLRNKKLPKKAVTFIYNESEKNFSAVALDATAGIQVNGNNLENGSTIEVNHGDYYTIGNETLRICMHYGANTCASCEPGLFMPVPKQEKETKAQRRRATENSRKNTMRQIMASYGIHHSQVANYNSGPRKKATGPSLINIKPSERPTTSAVPNPADPYQNCAARPLPEDQRKFAIPEKPVPAQNVPIKSDNVGFKLLKSMGWSEGQGLGKEKQGKAEPIKADLKNDRKGLGASMPREPERTTKEIIMDKTRKRFDQLNEKQEKL